MSCVSPPASDAMHVTACDSREDVVVPDTPPPLIELCASRVVTPTPDAMIVCEPCEEAVVSDVPPSSGPASVPCDAAAAVDASVSVVPPRASPDVRPGRNDLITLLRSPIPSGGKRLLHLFSGLTNRPGSLGWVARTLGYECADIDILNHPDHDVLHHDLEVEIVDSILSGRVTAVMLGTPCNTFSVARMHDDGGPEQLRSLRYPHGIPGISVFGRKAVEVSDRLIAFSIRVIIACKTSAVGWVLENPPGRGIGSEFYQAVFAQHVSLFELQPVRALMRMGGSQFICMHQCAWGGSYQKLTRLQFHDMLSPYLLSWHAFRCSHCFSGHVEVARGAGSAASAAYPAAMAWALVQALLDLGHSGSLLFSAPRFRSGSAKPHASDAEAEAAVSEARTAGSASLRRLEPESEEVLINEPFPVVNEPVVAEWESAPAGQHVKPAPRSTNELIPFDMQRRLREHRIRTTACYEAASRGRWRWARDHRPEPLSAVEDECICAGVPKGWSWRKRDGVDMWDPLTPSSWPDSPPDFELNAAAVLSYALEHRFTDMQVIAWMCHGYPGPDMPHHTVIGTPHVGALRDMEALIKCASKDRARGWGTYGHPLPPVWPTLCDPVNVVWRHGKPRMTIDKSMQLSALFESYNSQVRLDLEPTIDYVSVGLASRSTAILLTAGVKVSLWGFDIDAYFRKSGKQRSHWWMSGLLYWDGFANDPRIQFGQREAPVRTGRQSTFLRFAMLNELRRLDGAYPTKAGKVIEWLASRSRSASELGSDPSQFALLFYVMIFVDDIAGGSIDDPLYDSKGRPVRVLVDGVVVHQSRATLHYDACIGIIRYFGHDDSAGKGVPPSFRRDFLGVTEDVRAGILYLTVLKKRAYSADARAAINGRKASRGGTIVPYNHLNSLVHKLLHAASLIVLGRQHLWHLKAALRVRNSLRCGGCILHQPALNELEWWIGRLDQPLEEGVPLASRSSFPSSGDPSVLDSYSDASREQKSASSSGLGAWCVIAGDFCFVERRWTDHERRHYSINVLEYAAMNIGSFTFLREARRRGLPVTHIREHTDNTAAEWASERGRPSTREMHVLTERRYDRLRKEGVYAASFRVASIDNDIADGLSRGGDKLQDAIRMAVQAGLTVRRLEPDSDEDSVSFILRSA